MIRTSVGLLLGQHLITNQPFMPLTLESVLRWQPE
jgi:hypothetical protein